MARHKYRCISFCLILVAYSNKETNIHTVQQMLPNVEIVEIIYILKWTNTWAKQAGKKIHKENTKKRAHDKRTQFYAKISEFVRVILQNWKVIPAFGSIISIKWHPGVSAPTMKYYSNSSVWTKFLFVRCESTHFKWLCRVIRVCRLTNVISCIFFPLRGGKNSHHTKTPTRFGYDSLSNKL